MDSKSEPKITLGLDLKTFIHRELSQRRYFSIVEDGFKLSSTTINNSKQKQQQQQKQMCAHYVTKILPMAVEIDVAIKRQ